METTPRHGQKRAKPSTPQSGLGTPSGSDTAYPAKAQGRKAMGKAGPALVTGSGHEPEAFHMAGQLSTATSSATGGSTESVATAEWLAPGAPTTTPAAGAAVSKSAMRKPMTPRGSIALATAATQQPLAEAGTPPPVMLMPQDPIAKPPAVGPPPKMHPVKGATTKAKALPCVCHVSAMCLPCVCHEIGRAHV